MKRTLFAALSAISLVAGLAFAQTSITPPALIGDSRTNNLIVQETLAVTGASTLTGNVAIAGTTTMTGAVAMAAQFRYGVDAGSTDTYVATLTPAPTAYVTGGLYILKAATANTGAASVNFNALGAKTIVKATSTTLANSDIIADMLCLLVYDGTNMVLLNPRAL